ncbi:hypothetical protein [Bordetella genomosp. 1]|uniref:hypothetical protein n=1 Tax=Bordetella genomosp. 1 TaxID=1395607 RepID=UPI0011409435|nr:hypothetical protein [Bordetella genomosp. 1]
MSHFSVIVSRPTRAARPGAAPLRARTWQRAGARLAAAAALAGIVNLATGAAALAAEPSPAQAAFQARIQTDVQSRDFVASLPAARRGPLLIAALVDGGRRLSDGNMERAFALQQKLLEAAPEAQCAAALRAGKVDGNTFEAALQELSGMLAPADAQEWADVAFERLRVHIAQAPLNARDMKEWRIGWMLLGSRLLEGEIDPYYVAMNQPEIPDARLCESGRKMYRMARNLPPSVRAQLARPGSDGSAVPVPPAVVIRVQPDDILEVPYRADGAVAIALTVVALSATKTPGLPERIAPMNREQRRDFFRQAIIDGEYRLSNEQAQDRFVFTVELMLQAPPAECAELYRTNNPMGFDRRIRAQIALLERASFSDFISGWEILLTDSLRAHMAKAPLNEASQADYRAALSRMIARLPPDAMAVLNRALGQVDVKNLDTSDPARVCEMGRIVFGGSLLHAASDADRHLLTVPQAR